MQREQLKPGMEVAQYSGPRYRGQTILQAALDGVGTVKKVVVLDGTVRRLFREYVVDCEWPSHTGNPYAHATPLRELICPWVEYEATLAARKQERREQGRKEREERAAAETAASERRRRWELVDAMLYCDGVRAEYDEYDDKVSLTLAQVERLLGLQRTVP